MTIITYQESDRSRFRPSSFASPIRPVLDAVVRLRDQWRRRQTERMLEGLPAEIRKDIGWPTTNAAPHSR
ncbi:hypothetical protein NOJ28_06320 [Neorhizobium galegae]|uniref:hypothetical protein n=1 Tax=Neorhizobium galegae TaxID=399 RepID=UPI000621070B|nr:hypothetical protein [Neorhizobium galegae]MCQ1765137.1 hypothetical protein [Neorhizobium galegae]MCQ1844050.1 hypothetical protein [Neorhizobium galegae]CDZ33825.1 Hypothetical protein NGAL_HAMBI1146_05730 [Neorhizobium galegae bv. officinalis]